MCLTIPLAQGRGGLGAHGAIKIWWWHRSHRPILRAEAGPGAGVPTGGGVIFQLGCCVVSPAGVGQARLTHSSAGISGLWETEGLTRKAFPPG